VAISEAELTERVVEWIRQNGQTTDSSGREIAPDTDLLASGLLDSLGFIDLIAFIEEQDGCRVDLTDVDPDDFSRVKGLCRLALRKQH
jgi:acyl carrier protein